MAATATTLAIEASSSPALTTQQQACTRLLAAVIAQAIRDAAVDADAAGEMARRLSVSHNKNTTPETAERAAEKARKQAAIQADDAVAFLFSDDRPRFRLLAALIGYDSDDIRAALLDPSRAGGEYDIGIDARRRIAERVDKLRNRIAAVSIH
jgi:hypothetical protein